MSTIKEVQEQKGEGHQQQRRQFQVQITPKDLFPLFSNTNDSYIYEKKFYCDLPQNIIPPKSFHYPSSIDKFCQPDLLTMNFDLNKRAEILTDPKLNTNIHKDFINNTLALIFPNIFQRRDEQLNTLKRNVINIINRNDEVTVEKKVAPLSRPFFLRASTLMKSTLNAPIEVSSKPLEKKSNTNVTPVNIKKEIEKTFKDTLKIQVGYKHPEKANVTAKKVYDCLPMNDIIGGEYIQYVFPIDPSLEIKTSNKLELPEKFIIKKDDEDNQEERNEVISLYKNERIKGEENNSKYKAEFYSYEKDYTAQSAPELELFNRFFIFLDRDKGTAKFAPISHKIVLKKYKKVQKLRNDEDDDDGHYTQQKRKRDIIIKPKELEESEIIQRNKILKENGYKTTFKQETIGDIDCTLVEEIKKIKRETPKEEFEIEIKDSGYEGEKNENYENVEEKENNESKNEEMENEEKTPEHKNSDDDDALFEDDD